MIGQTVPTLPTPPARIDFGGPTTKATFYDTIVGDRQAKARQSCRRDRDCGPLLRLQAVRRYRGTADSVGDIAWDERVTDGHSAGG